jgi:membrane-associated phospholipid phosphatase
MLQPPLLIALLAAHGQFRRLHLFSFAFTFTLTVTCMIFYFVPAVSIYAHLKVPLDGFSNLHPVSTFQHLEFIEGMRSGTMAWIDPLKGAGLITFPSFHACGAVLLAWAFWGVRAARVPALMLNLTMLASTPLDGAHYLVDVIGGVLLAAAGIALARTLERHLGPGLAHGVARACAPLAAHPAFTRRPNPSAAG